MRFVRWAVVVAVAAGAAVGVAQTPARSACVMVSAEVQGWDPNDTWHPLGSRERCVVLTPWPHVPPTIFVKHEWYQEEVPGQPRWISVGVRPTAPF